MVGRGVQKMVSTLPPPCADFLKFTRSLHVGEEGSVCHNRNTKT